MRCKLALSFIISILAMTFFYATVSAEGTSAVVTGTRVNVRSYGDISNNRLFQVERGVSVEIHGICGDFFVATINGVSDVFISREWVRVTQTTGTVIADFAWVYDLPASAGGTPVTAIPNGENVTVTSVYAEWFGVSLGGTTAFMEQENVEIPCFVELPTARLGNSLADIIIAEAMNYLGTRYLWGGTSPNGFDCSGFMIYLLSPHGINLNRRSRDMANNGVFVDRSELLPGDLVFFGSGSHINHVGMYIGGGNFIHSSSYRSGGVRICDLHDAHNTRTFVTARRVLCDALEQFDAARFATQDGFLVPDAHLNLADVRLLQ